MKKLINLEKKEILLPLRDGEIESYNYQKFCCICKNKFDKVHDHDVSNGDSDDNDDDVFDTRKFHDNVVEPDPDVTIIMIVMIMIYLTLESFMVML